VNAKRFCNLVGAIASLLTGLSAGAADPVKIAHIDPLSGPFALVGESLSRILQASVDDVNARGGVLGGTKLELVNFDGKGSAQESIVVLKQIVDAGIHYVSLGSGSHVAHALVDAINKHNVRNPEQAVVLLNISAQDPPLTNEKCSYWHFRWEANTDMRVNALTDFIGKQKGVPKVYLINQDYAFGQAISRAAKEMLAAKRPDIRIVGDDFVALGKVKNFARVKLNGRDLGILWKAPFRLDVTGVVKPGANTLDVEVTNLWPNRLIGDEQQPPEVDYAPGGEIRKLPAWLVAGKPKPKSKRYTFATWRFYDKDSPLLESGLIGPVAIRSAKPVKL